MTDPVLAEGAPAMAGVGALHHLPDDGYGRVIRDGLGRPGRQLSGDSGTDDGMDAGPSPEDGPGSDEQGSRK